MMHDHAGGATFSLVPFDLSVPLLEEPLSLTPRLLKDLRPGIPKDDYEHLHRILEGIRRELVEPLVAERQAAKAAFFVYSKIPVIAAARQEIVRTFVRIHGTDILRGTFMQGVAGLLQDQTDGWATQLRGKERVLFEQAARQHVLGLRILLSVAPRVTLPAESMIEAIAQLVAPLFTAAPIFDAFYIPLAFSFEGETKKPLRPAVRAILIDKLESASLEMYKAAVAIAERFPPLDEPGDDAPLPPPPEGWIPSR